MKTLHVIIAGTALLFSNAIAHAQDWDWQPNYEHRFYQRWVEEPVHQALPPSLSVELGGVVPDDVDIYDAPADFDYAPVHRYRYVTVEKRIYVVEPHTRRVVHIIER
jgi:hypothetical protein